MTLIDFFALFKHSHIEKDRKFFDNKNFKISETIEAIEEEKNEKLILSTLVSDKMVRTETFKSLMERIRTIIDD